MKIKNISKIWKGRIKRRNFFIVVLVLSSFFTLVNNYLLASPLLLAMFMPEGIEIAKIVVYSLLSLIIALYMLCLSLRRAQDIGIRKGGVYSIAIFYGIQILIGVMIVPGSMLGYISFPIQLFVPLLINLISLPISLYLLCARSESKNNIYGVYEEETKRSFIHDIFNIQ